MSALRDRLIELLALKELPRAGWVRAGVNQPESVAAHSWGVAWLVLALCPEHLDRGKALAIAVVHDLAEVRIGDITPHDGVSRAEKHRAERAALAQLMNPFERRDELIELADEYGNSPEGLFVKACDKLDMALQAMRYSEQQNVDTSEFITSALAALDDTSLAALASSLTSLSPKTKR